MAPWCLPPFSEEHGAPMGANVFKACLYQFFGFLVLLNRQLLAVDGAHKLNQSNWASLAEAERSGVVSIVKAAKKHCLRQNLANQNR